MVFIDIVIALICNEYAIYCECLSIIFCNFHVFQYKLNRSAVGGIKMGRKSTGSQLTNL